MSEYRCDHGAQSQTPELREWIEALEDGSLDVATSCDLWSRLAEAGFIEADANRPIHADHATFHVRIASPKILDTFQAEHGPKTTYAYTRLKVCLRRIPVPPSLALHPWDAVALVDTEFFELPHGTTLVPDAENRALDDMEKIHLVYLAGTKDGRFVSHAFEGGVMCAFFDPAVASPSRHA